MRELLSAVALLAACSRGDGPARDKPAPPPTGSANPSAATSRLIFQDTNGRAVHEADLAGATGTLDWTTVGKDAATDEAQRLYDQGETAGARRDDPAALALFVRAHEAAPRWPRPLYEAARAYERMDKPVEALAAYEEVLALAPRGYFTAITSADCLRREAAHEWKPGTCTRYAQIDGEKDRQVERSRLKALVAEAPTLAQAWKDLAAIAPDEQTRATAIEAGLAARPDPEVRGYLLVTKALILDHAGNHDAAVRMLGALVVDPATPLDIVEIARLQLAQLARTDRR